MGHVEDDFADLDAIISESESRRQAKGGISTKYRKLAGHEISASERQALVSEVDAYERRHVWAATASVALFDTQTCITCGHTHRFFRGWFESQQHRADINCHRLVRGKSVDVGLPCRIEDHQQGSVEMCGDCAESCLVIDQFIKE